MKNLSDRINDMSVTVRSLVDGWLGSADVLVDSHGSDGGVSE